MKAKVALAKKDLVVVLACIIFLLANLAAIGPSGRRHAKQMLCLSNLHKWGTIFQAFAADNDGNFMPGWCASKTFPNPIDYAKCYWMEALRLYYGNEHDLRCCPEAVILGTDLGLGPWGGNGTFTAWGAFAGEVCGEPSDAWPYTIACDYGSYGWNGWLGNPPPDVLPDLGQDHPVEWNWRTANVAGADNIPLFTDNQWIDAWPRRTDDPPEYEGQPWWESEESMLRVCINRHNGFINSAFLDFSARKVGLKELWKLKWHRQFDVNYPPPDWPPWMQDFQDY